MFDKMKDLAKLKWSANLGNVDAQLELAQYYWDKKNDITEAIKWYEKAAGHRNSYAMFRMGWFYYYGFNGNYRTREENQNYYTAFRWFEKGARLDDPSCETFLGVLYFKGWGTDQDYDEAFRLFRKSVNAKSTSGNDWGYASSAVGLGECYLNGYGVTKNINEAVKWFRFAINNGLTYHGLMFPENIDGLNMTHAKKRLKELGYSV